MGKMDVCTRTVYIADMNDDKIADQVFLKYANGKFKEALWKDGTNLADPKAAVTKIEMKTDSYGNLFFYADAKVITNPKNKSDTGFDGIKDKVVVQGVRYYGGVKPEKLNDTVKFLDEYHNLKKELRVDTSNKIGQGLYENIYGSQNQPIVPEVMVQLNVNGRSFDNIKKYLCKEHAETFNSGQSSKNEWSVIGSTADLDGNRNADFIVIHHYMGSVAGSTNYQGEVWIGYSASPPPPKA